MTVLLCLDLLGILCSFFVNLLLIEEFILPSGKIAITLNIGIGLVVAARLVATKELRQGKGWFFDKSLKNICPSWLKVVIGLIVTYGIINCIFSLSGMVSMLSVTMTKDDYIIASRKLFIGLFSLIMVCYAIEFLILYLYKILKSCRVESQLHL